MYNLNKVKDIQMILNNSGFYNGLINGVFDEEVVKSCNLLIKEHKDENEFILPIKPYNENDIDKLLINCLIKKGININNINNYNQIRPFVLEYVEPFLNNNYDICWSKKVDINFTNRIKQWVTDNNLDPNTPDWLMAIMNFETAGTFSPTIKNGANANAYGLIQFMAPAASDLGTTLDHLITLTALQQLEYVFKYFKMWKLNRLKRLEDFYFAVFYPKAIGWGLDEIIFKEGSNGYKYNKGFDKDKKGSITVGDINSTIYKNYYEGMHLNNRRKLS